MGPEQRQQQRDFFLRTDLDHDDLLFAPLVGPSGEGVQDDLVSGPFQNCFIVGVILIARHQRVLQTFGCHPMIAPAKHSSAPKAVPPICIQYLIGMVSAGFMNNIRSPAGLPIAVAIGAGALPTDQTLIKSNEADSAE